MHYPAMSPGVVGCRCLSQMGLLARSALTWHMWAEPRWARGEWTAASQLIVAPVRGRWANPSEVTWLHAQGWFSPSLTESGCDRPGSGRPRAQPLPDVSRLPFVKTAVGHCSACADGVVLSASHRETLLA